MKVAILIERAQIGLGGAERSVSELTAELRRRGVEAVILAAKGDSSEQVRVLCDDRSGRRTSLKAFESAVEAHLKDHRCDIIHSTLPVAGADIYQPRGGSYRETMLRNIASYPNPLVRCLKRSTHGLNVRRLEYLRAEKKVCSPGGRTILAALSGYVKEQFRRHYGLADERICVIGNGVNTDFNPELLHNNSRREMMCQLLQINPKRPGVFFLFAANNPRLKGLRPLLYAFKQAVERCPAVFPVLVAAGSRGLGPYGGLVRRLGLTGHVHTLNAAEGIWGLLAACDAAVLPTYYDPCSRFILEALAMGKPVITSRYNGAAERYRNGRHGMVVNEPDDVKGLAEALSYYCDPAKIDLARRAIDEDNLRQEVSIGKHAEQLIRLYETILCRKRN
jgi:UDP-glucose:(heptosyl)LPS alpha-1,3-glucosyltransferase